MYATRATSARCLTFLEHGHGVARSVTVGPMSTQRRVSGFTSRSFSLRADPSLPCRAFAASADKTEASKGDESTDLKQWKEESEYDKNLRANKENVGQLVEKVRMDGSRCGHGW